ncbi:unnamed protein product [Polarella glacialis]|uniref:Anoctamin transmembrane domain-containing protein n=1 Tax=Polarella glacialis TaxID=89957 RepID=A0A813EAF2_POLGL|nr:unnamed protein product [Polarella glacialis]
MQDPRDEEFLRLRDKFGHPASPHFRRALLSGIVDEQLPGVLQRYFGQQIGFYFAFMQHLFGYGVALSVLLAPLLAIYSVDWAQHLVQTLQQAEKVEVLLGDLVSGLASEVTSSEASKSRWPLWSLLVGLTTTVWGQCVIESWKRKERRLAKEWGSSRADAGRTPRPSFRGRLALSRVDGRLTQVHFSKQLYQARVVAANLAFMLLWALTFAGIGMLFASNLRVQVAQEDYASLGALFSVVSIVLYNLFKIVAHLLTQAENHMEEESWDASLLVKKWVLTVVVQCWPIMHLLFIRPLLFPCAYGDPEVRQRLGVEKCAFWDYDCCNVELKSGEQVILSFAQVRSEAVVRHTRQFIAGWLVSKIFAHNLLKWIVPRLCGFLCTRGLYPLLAVDFAQDLLNGFTSESDSGRRRAQQRRLFCCRRRRDKSFRRSTTDLTADIGPSALPEEVVSACELQMDKQDPWDVLDTANDLSVHFLVTSLTTVIYPFAPLLFLAQLLVEFQMDLYQVFDRRQPKPRAAQGLPGAWLAIFQSYVYVGAISNLAIVTWRTSLVSDLFNDHGAGIHFAFFSTAMLVLVLVVGLVQLIVPDIPSDVKEHLQRRQEVEAFFIAQSRNSQVHDSANTARRTQTRPLQTNPDVADALANTASASEVLVSNLWRHAQQVR